MTLKRSCPVLRGLVGSNAHPATRLYGFVQMLAYKCLRLGKELHIINERDTTKMCHVCKRKKDMPLWQRTYRCENCCLVMDRDENSAVNIYERFLARPGPHTSAI
jgi:putative transposase